LLLRLLLRLLLPLLLLRLLLAAFRHSVSSLSRAPWH
jgi:hypothetical protein